MARPVEGAGKLKFVNNLGPESARIHLSGRERERGVLTLKQVEKGEADSLILTRRLGNRLLAKLER